MGDVAASGGYYIASIADEIYANPATLTGSIGVIFDLLNYEGLFNILGLSANTITAGEFKDIGSPTRPMTDEERQMLQDMLNQVHQQFKDAVKEGRGFTDQEINDIATGMIFNGEDALRLKLIDKLGGLNDALDRAAELAGLPKGYTVDHLGKTGLLDQLMSDLGGVSAPNPGNNAVAGALGQVIGAQQNPFYKLWSVILLDPRVAGENAGIQY
jgi:protease-4